VRSVSGLFLPICVVGGALFLFADYPRGRLFFLVCWRPSPISFCGRPSSFLIGVFIPFPTLCLVSRPFFNAVLFFVGFESPLPPLFPSSVPKVTVVESVDIAPFYFVFERFPSKRPSVYLMIWPALLQFLSSLIFLFLLQIGSPPASLICFAPLLIILAPYLLLFSTARFLNPNCGVFPKSPNPLQSFFWGPSYLALAGGWLRLTLQAASAHMSHFCISSSFCIPFWNRNPRDFFFHFFSEFVGFFGQSFFSTLSQCGLLFRCPVGAFYRCFILSTGFSSRHVNVNLILSLLHRGEPNEFLKAFFFLFPLGTLRFISIANCFFFFLFPLLSPWSYLGPSSQY